MPAGPPGLVEPEIGEALIEYCDVYLEEKPLAGGTREAHYVLWEGREVSREMCSWLLHKSHPCTLFNKLCVREKLKLYSTNFAPQKIKIFY